MPLSPLKNRHLKPNDAEGNFKGLTDAAKQDKLEELQAALLAEGESLTPALLLTRNNKNIPILAEDDIIQKIENILMILHEEGMSFSMQDLAEATFTITETVPGPPNHYGGTTTTTTTNTFTMIQYLSEKHLLKEFFQPYLWIDRLEEMDAFWEKLSPLARGQVMEINAIRDQVRAMSNPEFTIHQGVSREALFTANEYGFLPLETRYAWKNIGLIQAALSINGEALHTPDLLHRAKDGGTLLYHATKLGFFETMMQHFDLRAVPEEAFVEPCGPKGECVLEILSRQDRLDLIFNADIWKGRVREMVDTHHRLPPSAAEHFPIWRPLAEANAASLRDVMTHGGHVLS